MPIIRKMQVLLNTEGRHVRSVHRWAVVFGLITPMVLLLLTLLNSRGAMGIWPSLFSFAYEHAYYYGWAGMYVFGLLAFMLPELSDTEVKSRDSHVLQTGLALFGVGVAAVLAQLAADFYGLRFFSGPMAGCIAALIQAVGWLLLQYQVLVWLKRDRRQYSMHEWLQIGGLALMSAAVVMFAAVRLWLVVHEAPIFSVRFTQGLRLLPLAGLGMVSLGFLMRMMPELLGWRPLPDHRLKKIIVTFLASIVATVAAFMTFHQTYNPAFGTLYLAGAAGWCVGVIWLIVSMDVFRMRLAPPVNHEHVQYIYGSLAWLLINSGLFVVSAVWEFMNKQAIDAHWNDALLFSFFAGFVGLGLMGIYTYWVNQMPNAHPHKDVLVTIAFVAWNWVLTLRVFVYPLTVSGAWPGAHLFRLVLDIGLAVALVLISLDMYDGLIGHRLCFRKTCRR